METVQRRELWIHTHFVTDCVRLSHTQGRDIEAALLPVLRQQHIVYGIHFIELVTYVAQQVQEGEEISVHLAHLHRLLQEKSLERGLLNALIISFDVPQLRRLLHRERVSDALASPPPVLGRRMTLYKAILPGETQARIATDSLITRYLCWLARNSCRRAIALANTHRHVRLFVPEGSNFDPQQAWHEFMNFVFSGAELGRTFIAMLNSIQLSDRGFGVPEFPVVSEHQVLIVLAWLWHSVQTTEQRLKGREKRITELEASLGVTEGREANKTRRDIQLLQEAQIVIVWRLKAGATLEGMETVFQALVANILHYCSRSKRLISTRSSSMRS